MKKLVNLFLCMGCISCSLFGQGITKGEYFFNNDPGFNNGTFFTVTEVNGEFTKTLSIDASSLPNGFNTFYVRAKQGNVWGMYERSLLYKIEPNTIFTEDISIKKVTYAEYFFDTDPGLGNGTSISFTQNNEIAETLNIDITSLSEGFHTIYIRAKNAENKWSMFERSLFYVAKDFNYNFTQTPVSSAEYFFDTDPGLGQGTDLPLDSKANDINQTFTIDVSGLDAGFHTLYIRLKNGNNEWSMFDRALFYIGTTYTQPAESPIVKAEYFFNTFVENGTGIDIPLTTNADSNFETTIATTGLTEGEHLLFVRVQNEAGIWSLYDVVAFDIDNTLSTADVSNQVGVFPNPTTNYINLKTNLQLERYELYDVSGKVIMKNTLVSKRIPTESLSKGIYFLVLQSEKGKIVKRIVKE